MVRRCSKQISLLLLIFVVSTCGCLNRLRKDDLRMKEAELKQVLYFMRNSIDQYTQDKNSAPQDLSALVSAGYLRPILQIRSPTPRKPGGWFKKTSWDPSIRIARASLTSTAVPIRSALKELLTAVGETRHCFSPNACPRAALACSTRLASL